MTNVVERRTAAGLALREYLTKTGIDQCHSNAECNCLLCMVRTLETPLHVQQGLADGRKPLRENELNILRLSSTGFDTKGISAHLNVSPNTIADRLRAIFRKLDVSTRTEAVAIALKCGLI